MATKEVKMCDIDKCNSLGYATLPDFFYQVQGSMGYHFNLTHNVDLCAMHYRKYSSAIPFVHINDDNKHRTHETDVK